MSPININVNVQQLNLLAQKIEQIASEQSIALQSVDRKTKPDISQVRPLKRDITPSHVCKKQDISQTKKLY